MPSELSALSRASALPLTSFRREHVAQQVERACRREQVDGADGLARALGRRRVAYARARAAADERAGSLAAARQRPPRGEPVDDEGGARIGRLVVLRDVTREREVDQLKSDLMATVSHELRTPLASVLGYAELLRTRELSPAARDEMLGTVHREAKRLSALIDDFLDVHAIEQDRLMLSREAFSVGDLLAEQVRTFSGQSQKHRISFSSSAEPAVAFGDRARIAQVIANLLSNAIKYSPDGGTVEVSASTDAGFVLVAVADSGLGIAMAEQEHVFEKFFRAQRSVEAPRLGGTGLGLALAHEIIIAHGGHMGFESTEGIGSRFWFTLPNE